MKNRKNFFKTAIIGLFLLGFAISGLSALFSPLLSIIELSLTLAFLIAVLIFWGVLKKQALSLFNDLSQKLSPESREALADIPMPICVLGKNEEIEFYNNVFSLDVLGGENYLGKRFFEHFLPSDKRENSVIFGSKK
ncbi:MAG: hypothetical protein IIX89_02125, partial [Oscillospiraceae bacterium]|nr:hypothetical protein [Oscillospiraceae bacterium]